MTNSWEGERKLRDALAGLEPGEEAVLTVQLRGDQSSLVDVLEHGFLPQLVPQTGGESLDDYVRLGGEGGGGTAGGFPSPEEYHEFAGGGEGKEGTVGGVRKEGTEFATSDDERPPEFGEGRDGRGPGVPSPSFAIAYTLADEESASGSDESAGPVGTHADVYVQLAPESDADDGEGE